MLRVEFNRQGDAMLTVRLQGRLVGVYAEDARLTLAQIQFPQFLLVDLSEVTFVDAVGVQVLLWLGRLGAQFVAANVFTRSLCDRLELKVSESAADPGQGTNVHEMSSQEKVRTAAKEGAE